METSNNSRGFGTLQFKAESDQAFGRTEIMEDGKTMIALSGHYNAAGVQLVSVDGKRLYQLTGVPGAREKAAAETDDKKRAKIVRLRGTVTLNAGTEAEETVVVAVWENKPGVYGISESSSTKTHSPF